MTFLTTVLCYPLYFGKPHSGARSPGCHVTGRARPSIRQQEKRSGQGSVAAFITACTAAAVSTSCSARSCVCGKFVIRLPTHFSATNHVHLKLDQTSISQSTNQHHSFLLFLFFCYRTPEAFVGHFLFVFEVVQLQPSSKKV